MGALEPHFGGRIGTTVAESEPWWPARPGAGRQAPNVVQIVFDDTGWADFGCFGSEIDTPNLDALARGGLRYTQFHVTPLCSPTRASLFTGRNHHRVGMRFLADIDTGFPNSRGHVAPDLPTVPGQLRDAGYGTYLVGKWHLTPQHEITPAGPFRHWPLARGFDRFYGFLDGCTDQYDPELYEDNHPARPERGPGYHLTTDLADRAIRLISDHQLYRPDAPFYLAFAPGATHAPLQAPRELIDKYVPVFEKGWDRTRADRLERQIALGLVPPGTALTPRNPGVVAWAELGADEQRLFVRLQAAFAAFLEHADAEIGRLMAHLEQLGLRDNTLVSVISDNGASREGGRHGAVDVNGPYSGVRESLADQLARMDMIGGPEGPAHYPEGWAMAGNTPFRRYKQSVDLGGVRSPLIVSWPRGITASGEVRTQFAHVIDLAATVLDLAGVESAVALDGASLGHTLLSPDAPAPRTTQYWEMFGHRAIWQQGWKAVTEHVPGEAYSDDRWRLYDLGRDFAENTDVAADEPERLAGLIEAWWREARANDVLPLDDRSLVELLNNTQTPHQLANRRVLALRPEISHVPVSTGVASLGRPLRLSARTRNRRPGDDGIILAGGSPRGGYQLGLEGERLVFSHAALARRVHIAAEIGYGDSQLALEVRRRGEASLVVLEVEGRPAATGIIPVSVMHPSFWGLDVGPAGRGSGRDWLRSGVVVDLTMEFLEEMTLENMADLLAKGD